MNLPPNMIPGSWEARAWEVEQLLKADDPRGLELAHKVVKRLSALPLQQKMAGEALLAKLQMGTARNAINYLLGNERYDEALQFYTDYVAPVEVAGAPSLLIRAHTRLLRLAGEDEAALHMWQQWNEYGPTIAFDLGIYIGEMVALKRYDEAEAALREFERQVAMLEEAEWELEVAALSDEEIDEESDEEDDEESDALEGNYSEQLRTMVLEYHIRLLAETGRWREAVALFNTALEDDQPVIYLGYYLVELMLTANEAARADTLLDILREESSVWYFLKGVCARRRGKQTKAEAMWNAALGVEPPANEEVWEHDIRYTVFSAYALGDADGNGLATILSELAAGPRENWLLLFAAAIGWALRGNMKSVRVNMRHAARIYRTEEYESRMLPVQHWYFVTELLPPDKQAAFRPYFEPSTPPAKANDAPAI